MKGAKRSGPLHPDQLAFGESGRKRIGRHERSIGLSAKAAREADLVRPWHVAALSTARGLARALDDAERVKDGWLVARLGSELRQTLAALAWLPEGSSRDDLDDLAALFGTPTVSDTPRS